MSRVKNLQISFDYEVVCQIAAKAVVCYWISINAPYSRLDLEEIVNDAAVNVAKHNSEYDSSMSKYTTWVSVIAKRAAISYWSKHHKHDIPTTSLTKIDDEGKEYDYTPCIGYRYSDDTDQTLISQERLNSIYDAIDALGSKGMMLLMSLDGKKYAEIAQAYDITADSVGSNLHRARLKLSKSPLVRSIMNDYRISA